MIKCRHEPTKLREIFIKAAQKLEQKVKKDNKFNNLNLYNKATSQAYVDLDRQENIQQIDNGQ